MTTAQKLEKLIEKATKNGWKDAWEFDEYHPYEIIFNHDFLKALFGDMPMHVYGLGKPAAIKGTYTLDKKDHIMSNWGYQGQQAIVKDDPVNYLYKQAIGGEDER